MGLDAQDTRASREAFSKSQLRASELPLEVLEFLSEKLADGRFALLAYSLDPQTCPHTIGIATTRITDLPLGLRRLQLNQRRRGYPPYHLGHYLPLEVLRGFAAGLAAVVQYEQRDFNQFNADWHMHVLGETARARGYSYWASKGFALVDICGFTSMLPEQQIAARMSLAQSVVQAASRVARLYDSGHLHGRSKPTWSSTGDGYILWSREHGGAGDVATFMLLLCVMVQNSAIRCKHDTSLLLRGAFTIGGAYTFPFRDISQSQTAATLGESLQDAIGPAINALARLVQEAEPEQVLLGEFGKQGRIERNEQITPESIIQQAAGELFASELIPSDSMKATDIKLRLNPESAMRVRDKHQAEFYCYNVTGVLPSRFPGKPVQPQQIGVEPTDAELLVDRAFCDASDA